MKRGYAAQTDPYVINTKRTKLEQVVKGVEDNKKQQLVVASSKEENSVDTLLLHLSEYALYAYNMDRYADSCFTLNQDKFYRNVNLVDSSFKTSYFNNITSTTYRLIFEASLPADETTQIFIAKVFMSFSDPPSTVKIGFRSVKIKEEEESDYEDNDDEYDDEEEEEEEDNLSDSECSEDDPEIDSEPAVEDHSQKILHEYSESVVEDHPLEILLEFHKNDTQENLSSSEDRVHGESLSESDGIPSKDTEFFKSDEKHSKDSEESLSKSNEKHSEDSKENSEFDKRCSKHSEEHLSKFCDGEPPKDSRENLSEFDNVQHFEDSKEILSEFEEKDTRTGVRYHFNVDPLLIPPKYRNEGYKLSKEIKSFNSDAAKSDGFEVGRYPLMDAAGIHGTWIYKFYDGDSTTINHADMDRLVCLSRLAISIYNRDKNTRFGNVIVLKAMTSGGKDIWYNITFKASLPDKTTETFRTRILTKLPIPYEKIEIEFVTVKPN